MPGDLPTSTPGSTINALALQPANTDVASTLTPAIARLLDAYDKGFVGANEVLSNLNLVPKLKTERQKLSEEYDTSKARQSLIPDQTQLAKAQIGSDFQLLPKKTAATAAGLDADIALRPLQTQIGLAQGGAQLPEAQLMQKELQADPTGTTHQSRVLYQSLYPGEPVPTDANGNYDYQKMGQMVAPFMHLQRLYGTPQGQAALKAADEKKRWDLLQNPDGTPKHPQQALQDITAAPMPLTGEQTQEQAGNIAAIDEGLKNILEARKYVNDKTVAPVGPEWNKGSWLGKGAASAQAFFGLGSNKFDQQSRLSGTLSKGILDSTQQLKGAVRNTEIELLKNKLPKLSDTPERWNEWLNNAEQLLRTGREAKMKGLPGDISHTLGTAPAAKPEVPKDLSGLPSVTSQADYDKVPKNSWYIFNGKPVLKLSDNPASNMRSNLPAGAQTMPNVPGQNPGVLQNMPNVPGQNPGVIQNL